MRLLSLFRRDHSNPWEQAPPWAIELRKMLSLVLKQGTIEMGTQQDIADALAKVQADVAAQTTVVASVKTYVQGLVAQIAALSSQTTDTTTAAALATLASQIEANTQSDADAIVANTPAA